MTRVCSIEGCGKKHNARGLCRFHYHQWRRVNLPKKLDKLCSIPHCGKPANKRGWCAAHYTRWLRYGDANISKGGKKGEGCITKSGNSNRYIKYITVTCPFRGKRVQILEHQWIAEQQILGRRLTNKEVVHHIDLNSLNNALSNLQVMTKEEHARLHTAIRNWQSRVQKMLDNAFGFTFNVNLYQGAALGLSSC